MRRKQCVPALQRDCVARALARQMHIDSYEHEIACVYGGWRNWIPCCRCLPDPGWTNAWWKHLNPGGGTGAWGQSRRGSRCPASTSNPPAASSPAPWPPDCGDPLSRGPSALPLHALTRASLHNHCLRRKPTVQRPDRAGKTGQEWGSAGSRARRKERILRP